MKITKRKVGGLTFLRVGRLQVSWCVTKAQPKAKPSKPVQADHEVKWTFPFTVRSRDITCGLHEQRVR